MADLEAQDGHIALHQVPTSIDVDNLSGDVCGASQQEDHRLFHFTSRELAPHLLQLGHRPNIKRLCR